MARAAIRMTSPRCLICQADAATVRYRLTEFSIYRCDRCGQIYLWPLPSEEAIRETFEALYSTGETTLPELRGYYDFCFDDAPSNPLVQLYDAWLDALERRHVPGTLLDVGCGTGLFLAVARRRGWEPSGVDDSAEATEHARGRFGLAVETGDFASVADRVGRFDAVTMWDIIEHSRDPVGLLTAVRGVLAPGGIVGLSTPNQRSMLDVVAGTMYRLSGGRVTAPLEKFYIDQHFVYFSPATLAAALERAGLEVIAVQGESTDLRRLTLSAPVRLGLRALFLLGRLTGLENRIFAVARAR
jgi:2-polyprenyl-3-methyl-5-hydroxy-6-metoxy-1,4-benzoquinol methylase